MVEKKVSKSRKNALLKGDLTPTEAMIFHLLVDRFETPKKVAIKRNTSKQAIYQHIRNIRKKGYLKKGYTILEKNRCTIQANNTIRLHAMEFNIQILWLDNRYRQLISKSNIINIEGNTVKLNRNTIEVYINHSFEAEATNKATFEAFIYINKLLVRLENDLRIELIKARKQNIKLVKAHYSHTHNGIAKQYELSGEKLQVRTNDDGKVWCHIDNSFNLHEMEFIHPETSKSDMDKMLPFLNDLRENDYIPLSQLSKYMLDTAKQLNEISHGLKAILEVVRPFPQETKGYVNGDKPKYIG